MFDEHKEGYIFVLVSLKSGSILLENIFCI